MSDTPWENFSAAELACRCGCGLGHELMDTDFMDYIQTVRTETGIIMRVTSAVRCDNHDNGQGGARAHTVQAYSGKCHALDINVWGKDYDTLDRIFSRDGFITGRGAKQHGPTNHRFMHIDNHPEELNLNRYRPIAWTYE